MPLIQNRNPSRLQFAVNPGCRCSKWVRSGLRFAVAAALTVQLIAAETERVFQNGVDTYQGASSTMLIAGEKNSGLNFGNSPAVFIGAGKSVERRTLLRFDLSSLAGTKVTRDCELEIVQVNTSAFTEGSFTVSIFAVASGNASWVSGRGNSELAQDGEPNWEFLSANRSQAEVKRWIGEAGLRRAGVDHDAEAIAVWNYNAAQGQSIITIAIPRETVQRWIDAPNENGGLLFVKTANPEGLVGALGGFYSEKNRSVTLRPRLKIYH